MKDPIGPQIWDISKQNKQHSYRPLKILNQGLEKKIQADLLITQDVSSNRRKKLSPFSDALIASHNAINFLRKRQSPGLAQLNLVSTKF